MALKPPNRIAGVVTKGVLADALRRQRRELEDGSVNIPNVATIPTGTGFRHITLGLEDSVAKLVDTADINPLQVTYAKIQNVAATSRLLGRKTVGAGVIEELTLSEALDFISGAAQGDILFRGASAWQRLAADTAGKFLKTQGVGADPMWDTPSGGGGGGGSSELSAPRTPQTEDDEFDATSLDAKWTQATTGTAPTISIDQNRRSNYLAEFGAADGSVNLVQAFVPGSADFSVTAKFHLQTLNNYQGVALFVYDSGISSGIRLACYDLPGGAGTAQILGHEFPAFTQIGGSVNTTTGTSTIVLHIQRTSGVYHLWWSYDGFGWVELSATSSLSFTVAKIKLELFQSGSTVKTNKSIDWVRRNWIFL